MLSDWQPVKDVAYCRRDAVKLLSPSYLRHWEYLAAGASGYRRLHPERYCNSRSGWWSEHWLTQWWCRTLMFVWLNVAA